MTHVTLAVAIALTAYLLVITYVCWRKLREVRPWRQLLCSLFPASQLCVVDFVLWCDVAYDVPTLPVAAVVVLGVLCGLVDLLLFRALREACRHVEAAEEVRELEDQLAVQELLCKRSEHEREESDKIRHMIRENLVAAEADLRLRHASGAGANLDKAIDAIGLASARRCQHPAVDALVELKQHDAQALGVQLDVHLNVPLDLALPSAEVCAVFSNLLDNALRACAAVPQGQRVASVTARMWGRYFVVDVENSCVAKTAAQPAKTNAMRAPDEATPIVVTPVCASVAEASCAHVGEDRAAALEKAPAVAGRGSATSGASAPATSSCAPAESELVPAPPAIPDVRVLHGWGQGIVNDIAERHDGQFTSEEADGRHHARVILRVDGGERL